MNEPSSRREEAQSNASTRLRKIREGLLAQTQELATLAALICPELCLKHPSRAIKKAQALLDAAWSEIAEPLKDSIVRVARKVAIEGGFRKEWPGPDDDDRLKKAWLAAVRSGTWMELTYGCVPRELVEYYNSFRRPFEYGVKYITGEERLDRAMPWFRKFIGSRTPNEQACNIEIAKARQDGFTGVQLRRLRVDFDDWKPTEKSRIARIKSAKRKKKGQV
jgi:hypothetical protein